MVGCLIIHGFTGGPYELEPLIENLKKNTNFRIEVPVLPGHGPELDLSNVTYQEWLEASEKSFQHLSQFVDEIYIIGFSMGGMISAYIASKYKVDKLVLLATAGKYISIKRMGQELSDVLKDSLTGQLNENNFYQRYKEKRSGVPIKANFEFMKLVSKTKRHLKYVKTPVLIIQGEMDSMVPYQTADYLAEKLSSVSKEVVLFDQAKHQICLGDEKDILNGMVETFLTSQQKE